MAKIVELPKNPAGCVIYRRLGGDFYFRINERYHMPAQKRIDGSWIGIGETEEIDPNEEVEVIQRLVH